MTSTPTVSAESVVPLSPFARDLRDHIRAGYQIMYVQTTEEFRVEQEIGLVARALRKPEDPNGYNLCFWDCYEGFTIRGKKVQNAQQYRAPGAALDAVAQIDNDEQVFSLFGTTCIVVFRDLDDYMPDFSVVRRLRTIAEGARVVNNNIRRPIVIVSPTLKIPQKLKANIAVLEFELPGEADMERTYDYVNNSRFTTSGATPPPLTEEATELRSQIVANLRGMTSSEAENCLARCLVIHKDFTPAVLPTIKREKASLIKKSDVLTYIPEDSLASRDEIGGFDNYMAWLDRRKLAYTKTAREEKIDYPKGVVLCGVPGTGKSLVAKATCKHLGMPGYILDIGALFGSLVGESESRTRDALRQINAEQGCVVVIDEADKALGNAHDAQGDSGVTKRVFGTILTWLAENQDRTFCIMTLNRAAGLPPELLRAGRFDAIFYTALPTVEERRHILNIHFGKRGVDTASLGLTENDWATICDKTKQFVGAELEEVVRESRYISLAESGHGRPSFEQILQAVNSIKPLMEQNADAMQEIMDFCKNMAQPVSNPPKTVATGRRTRRIDVGN